MADLRVLHVIPSISPLRGGPSQAVLAMAGGLRKQGVDARVLTTNDDGPGLLADMPLGVWHERQGVPVLAFPRWSPPWRPLREFAVSVPLVRWLEEHLHTVDLLHVHALFSFPSTAAMVLARRRRMPYLLRTIGQLNSWSLQQSAGRKALLMGLVERANLEGAAALHFTSEAEQQQAAALALPTPTFVLPLGVRLADPATDPSPTDPIPTAAGQPRTARWLYLSRLHPKKQLPVLFEALARLRSQLPAAPWQLVIAGEGDPAYTEELRQLAGSLGLADHLQWAGFVKGEPKRQLFASADWFILPSASENFGIAAAEALAAGVPVLLSPGVALAQAAQEAGAGLVCAAEPEALAEALEGCLHPPSEARRTACRRLAAELFSWEAITPRLIARYRAILQPQL